MVLAGAAFSYNAREFQTLNGHSDYSNLEVRACAAAEGSSRLAVLTCQRKLAAERARFEVLGSSFGLGTAAALLSAAFSATVAAMVVVSRRGDGGEGLVEDLVERRIVRLPLLAASGWGFSFLVGHAWFGATNNVDRATYAPTQVALAALYSVAAIALVARRKGRLLALSVVGAGAAVWGLCIADVQGISNVQLVPALCIALLIMLEFLDEPEDARNP